MIRNTAWFNVYWSPIALALVFAVYVLFVTHFRGELLGPESYSAGFDSLGESLMKGECSVDPDIIGNEARIIRGKPTMYFGPFPSILRIVASSLLSTQPGFLGRPSGLLAASLSVLAFLGIMKRSLDRNRSTIPDTHGCFRFFSALGFALGTPILLLIASVSIYHETILWGLFWSLLGIWCLWAPRSDIAQLTLFSLSCAGAVLSRLSFALPLFIILAVMAIAEAWNFLKSVWHNPPHRLSGCGRLLAILLPASIAVAFQLWLNDCRYGDWTIFIHPIEWQGKPIAQFGGFYNPIRIAIGVYNYFLLLPVWQNTFPFWSLSKVYYPTSAYFIPGYREWSVSLLATSPFMISGAIMGFVSLMFRTRGRLFNDAELPKHVSLAAVLFFAQGVLILSCFFHTLRYASEFLPVFVTGFSIFLARVNLSISRASVRILLVLSIWSILATTWIVVSWHQMPENWMVSASNKGYLMQLLGQNPDKR